MAASQDVLFNLNTHVGVVRPFFAAPLTYFDEKYDYNWKREPSGDLSRVVGEGEFGVNNDKIREFFPPELVNIFRWDEPNRRVVIPAAYVPYFENYFNEMFPVVKPTKKTIVEKLDEYLRPIISREINGVAFHKPLDSRESFYLYSNMINEQQANEIAEKLKGILPEQLTEHLRVIRLPGLRIAGVQLPAFVISLNIPPEEMYESYREKLIINPQRQAMMKQELDEQFPPELTNIIGMLGSRRSW